MAVSVQGAGPEGFPGVSGGLKAWDPERYGSQQLPVDSYAADVLSQAAMAVGAGGARDDVDPLDGLKVPLPRRPREPRNPPCICGAEYSDVATYNEPASVRPDPHAGMQQPRTELSSRVQHFA